MKNMLLYSEILISHLEILNMIEILCYITDVNLFLFGIFIESDK